MILGIIIIGYGITRSSKTKAHPPGILQTGQQDLQLGLQDFMDELEKSNLELIDTVHQLQNDLKRESDINRKRIEKLEQRIEWFEQRAETEIEPEPAQFALAGAYAQVAKLRREGLSLAEIARKLGMGIGEVELAMRFSLEGEAQ
ncbi:MAG: hypothetical protein JWN30_953 [Bacilli bacterium]|nr:hypothetical protein [Bacilli bacterium]